MAAVGAQEMKTLTLKLKAGERNNIMSPGSFLYLVESTAAVDFEIDSGKYLSGMLAGTWAEPGDFSRIGLTSAVDQTIKLLVSNGRAGVFRVSGEVSVIDGSASRVKEARSFWTTGSSTASAGQYPHVQLWNPAASGKNVIITSLALDALATGQSITLGFSSVALTTIGGAAKSKLQGAADSVAELRNQSIASVTVPVIHTAFSILANDTKLIPLLDPIIVKPGFGYSAAGNTVATTIRGNWQHYEEAI